MQLACVNTPEAPVVNRFSRSSTWKIDTLSRQNSYYSRIWARSASDAYVVGSGGDIPNAVWHFDGTSWKLFSSQLSQTIPGIIDPEGIFGFSSTDIWIVGAHLKYNPTPTSNFTRSILLAHFNGSSWTEVQMAGGALYSIWGLSPNSIWAGGEFGEIFHFDGSTWSRDSVAPFSTSGDFWYFSHIVGSDNESPYSTIYSVHGSNGYPARYLLQRQGGRWTVLDSLSSTANDIYHLWLSGTNTLYGAGGNLCRWDGSFWQPLQPSGALPPILNVFGSADDNLFGVGQSGFFCHFNGSDWFDLPGLLPVSNSFIYGGWTDGSKVFLCAQDGIRSLILRNH